MWDFPKTKMRTIIFNKPYGVLSQFTDEGTGHPTLMDYINVPGVYAAGREGWAVGELEDGEPVTMVTQQGEG